MLTLRYSPPSPFARKVRIAAALLGLDDRVEAVETDTLAAGDSIRRQNPLGKIPTLVLEDGRACDILLTGPAGRTGMTVVRSARIGPAMSQAVVPEPGRWQVVAACGARERPVLPAWIEVSPSARDITVRLTWPQ